MAAVIKNLGLNIPVAIERCKRSLQHAPKENFAYIKNAKKDFEYYANAGVKK